VLDKAPFRTHTTSQSPFAPCNGEKVGLSGCVKRKREKPDEGHTLGWLAFSISPHEGKGVVTSRAARVQP
jgi:hypothetical protein